MITSVLFVCLGNICRSPAAEGAFLNILYQENLAHEFLIDSAGTSAFHVGQKPDPCMIERANERGISLPSFARQFSKEDFDKFDYIICMDKKNKRDVLSIDLENKFSEKVFLMRDFSTENKGEDVPDPYYGDLKDFDRVIDIVQDASSGLLKFVQQQKMNKKSSKL